MSEAWVTNTSATLPRAFALRMSPAVVARARMGLFSIFASAVSVRRMDGIEETVKFPLPKGLKLE